MGDANGYALWAMGGASRRLVKASHGQYITLI